MPRSTFHPAVVLVTIVAAVPLATTHAGEAKMPDAMQLPAIQAAYQTKLKIQQDVRQLDEAGKEIEVILTQISNQPPILPTKVTDAMVDEVLQSVTTLQQSAKAILDKSPRYVEKVDALSATLASAPATFRDAAKLFRGFSDEETYSDVADSYRQVATLFDNLAARTEEGNNTLRTRYSRTDLMQTIDYIKHQEQFLGRCSAALHALDSLRGMDGFMKEIETYAKSFEQFRTRIRELNALFQNMDDQPRSPAPGKTAPPSPNGPPSTPSHSAYFPTSVDPGAQPDPRAALVQFRPLLNPATMMSGPSQARSFPVSGLSSNVAPYRGPAVRDLHFVAAPTVPGRQPATYRSSPIPTRAPFAVQQAGVNSNRSVGPTGQQFVPNRPRILTREEIERLLGHRLGELPTKPSGTYRVPSWQGSQP